MLWKRGSFAAASAKLFKTPSALSYTIHRLESDLNIQLLDRSGHRARFTPQRTDAAGERAGGAAYRPRTGDPGG
ncbi:LysR family transcriptional regulator [Klebsiella variicola subsp. variicola]|nr:LysR family transcriptional regulator [Klebsiella variicola subsp. variicola]